MYPGYEDWMQSFMKVLIEKAHMGLKSGKLLVLHLSHFKNVNFVDDCERLMTEAGFEVQSRWRWKQRNFFRGKDAPKRYEPFLVGKKL